MKILVRGNKMRRWEFAEPIATKAETELQHLLIESPSLIPISDICEGISPLVIAVDEFGLPGSGNTDLLAFTADGDTAIIECKLATNADGWLSPQLSADIMQEFHSKVTAISPFGRIPAEFSKWHSIGIAEAFKNPEYLEWFKQVAEWLHSRTATQ